MALPSEGWKDMSAKHSKTIVEIENLNKSFYGNRVLKDVNIKIDRGEVLGLVGENGAGKSTLIKILSGVYHSDSGSIKFDERIIDIKNINIAKRLGVSVVFQELSLFNNLTVSENIFVDSLPSNQVGFVHWKELNRRAVDLLDKFDVSIDPEKKVADLDFADRQVIEITKALSMNPRLLILDEPTSGISEHEAEKLYNLISEMKKQGFSIIFISHYIEEILSISDRVAVLRDGELIGVYHTAQISKNDLIERMIGRKVQEYFDFSHKEKADAEKRNVMLEVRELTKKGHYENISFKLYEGEILGICELSGGIKDKIFKTIYGCVKPDSGTILVDGVKVKFNNVRDAITRGVGYITSDRKNDGLFVKYGLKENIVSHILKGVSKGIFIFKKKIVQVAKRFIDIMRIRFSSYDQLVMFLSGGNQQKIVVSKSLSSEPRIVIANDPTRGIDIGSKEDIHILFRELTSRKVGIIFSSSNHEEVINMSDRILAISKSRKIEGFNKRDMNLQSILLYING
jgi:ABC-type sugar transport system ATPase subunit